MVIAACAGDADAFAALIDEFTPTVYAVAFGLSGDEHLAADITQEAFTTAYLKLDTLRDPAALPGWLVAVTRSAARVARPSRPVASVRDFVASVDDDVVRADEARRVRRAVEALPAVERLPMALHYFAGRPLAEVAELCDVPLSTVKKRMRTARARIRRGEPKMTTNEATLIGAERSGPSDSARMFSAMRTGDPTVVGTLLVSPGCR